MVETLTSPQAELFVFKKDLCLTLDLTCSKWAQGVNRGHKIEIFEFILLRRYPFLYFLTDPLITELTQVRINFDA